MGLVDQIEIANPTQPHCATVLLLDTSGSMGGEKIAELNRALIRFKEETIKDDLARVRMDLAVVTFGGEAQLIQDFCSIEDFEPPTLIAQGGTPMGQAILKASEIVEQRKKKYKSRGIDFYRPWIFLMTDGSPTDMEPGDATWNEAVNRIHTGEAQKKFVFFAVAVEPADTVTLAKFAPPNRPPIKLIGSKFVEMFTWLSRSQAKASSAKVGDSIQIENPVAAGWGEVSV